MGEEMTKTNKEIMKSLSRRDVWFGRIVVVLLLLSIVGFSVFWLNGGCTPPCKPLAMRCNGPVVQGCTPDKKWRTIANCDKLHRSTKRWCCVCADAGRCTCKPQVGAGVQKDAQ